MRGQAVDQIDSLVHVKISALRHRALRRLTGAVAVGCAHVTGFPKTPLYSCSAIAAVGTEYIRSQDSSHREC